MEHLRPVAALIPERLNSSQVRTISAIITGDPAFDDELARRWDCVLVIADREWAHHQKKRVPMLPPGPTETACLKFV